MTVGGGRRHDRRRPAAAVTAAATSGDSAVVRGVLLDVDDTLVDTRAAFRAAIDRVVARWMPFLDGAGRDDAVRFWVLDDAGAFAAYTRGELTFAEQRRIRAERLHARLGGPALDDTGFARWEEAYEAGFRAAWRAHDDGRALVAMLRALGIPTGAVTNAAREYQVTKLAAVGLAQVPVLVSVDDLGRGKPDPAVFHLACERLGLPPGEVAYVGDELDVDARGARDAGLTGVWLDRHGVGLVPDDVPAVRTLAELPALLRLTR
ncbi:MAG TPA: HAD family hydrolase [Kineosporiaceae bacterium]